MLHKIAVPGFVFVVWLCFSLPANADVFMPFRFGVTASQEVYKQGAPIVLSITVTNTDSIHTWPLLWPGNPFLHDNRLLGVSIFKETGTESHYVSSSAFRDATEADRDKPRIWQLAPLQTLSVSLHLALGTNDMWNMALWPGHYRLEVYYHPLGFAPPDLYHFVASEKDSLSAERPNFLKKGVAGGTCDLSVRNNSHRPYPFGGCGERCHFCRCIEQGRWDRVEHYIRGWIRQTNRVNHIGNHGFYGMDEHRLLYTRLRQHRQVRFKDGAMSDLFRREKEMSVEVPVVFVQQGKRIRFQLRFEFFPWNRFGVTKRCPGLNLKSMERPL